MDEEEVRSKLNDAFASVETTAEAEHSVDTVESAARGETGETFAGRSVSRLEDQTANELLAVGKEAARDDPGSNEAVDVAVEASAHASAGSRAGAGRDRLREALLRRLGPLDKLDVGLFIAINRLPHPPWADASLGLVSRVMTGGHAWAAVPVAVMVVNRRGGWRAFLGVMPAIWTTTALVEYGVKRYFRRKRPFVSTVEAIVVGRKPGSYSFPSGHSAAAAGGAALLSCDFPRWAPAFWSLAGLVKFSRVYLGAHYPGDVLSGALLGVGLGIAVRRGIRRLARISDA